MFGSTRSVGLLQINIFDIWGSPAVQIVQRVVSLDHDRQKSGFFRFILNGITIFLYKSDFLVYYMTSFLRLSPLIFKC